MNKHAMFIYCAVLVLAGCSSPPASSSQAKAHHIVAGEIGSRLPDFSAKDLSGGQVSSADLRGKVVLIDFWATWCQPCAKEMPGYQRLLDKYGSRGFVVVGVKATMMHDREDPMRFMKRLGVRYPSVVATESLTREFGGIEGLPTTFLYDREGVLRDKVIGFEYTATFEGALKALL